MFEARLVPSELTLKFLMSSLYPPPLPQPPLALLHTRFRVQFVKKGYCSLFYVCFTGCDNGMQIASGCAQECMHMGDLVMAVTLFEGFGVGLHDLVSLFSDVLKAKRRYETGLEKLQSAQLQVRS